MLRNIIPYGPNKMSVQYKVICGCERFISAKIIHYYLIS